MIRGKLVLTIGVLALWLCPAEPSASPREVPPPQTDAVSRIVIFPFAVKDTADIRTAERLSEDVLALLASISVVQIMPSALVRQAQNASGGDDSKAARALGVRYLLSGIFIRAGSHFRLAVEVMDVRDERRVLSEVYDCPSDSLSGLAARVVRDVAPQVAAPPAAKEGGQSQRAKASRMPLLLGVAYLLLLAVTAILVIGKKTRWPSLVGVAVMPPYFILVLLKARRSSVAEGPKGVRPKAGAGDERAVPICAECRRSFGWEESYVTQETPGWSYYQALGTGDTRPRLFCPHCGALVVDWHMTGDHDFNEWAWFGKNGASNRFVPLPPNPYCPGVGKGIPAVLRPYFSQPRLDIDRMKEWEKNRAARGEAHAKVGGDESI